MGGLDPVTAWLPIVTMRMSSPFHALEFVNTLLVESVSATLLYRS